MLKLILVFRLVIVPHSKASRRFGERSLNIHVTPVNVARQYQNLMPQHTTSYLGIHSITLFLLLLLLLDFLVIVKAAPHECVIRTG